MESSGDYIISKDLFIACLVITVVLFVAVYWFLKKKGVMADSTRNLLRLSLALFPVILLPFVLSPVLTANNKIFLTVIGLGISIAGFWAADIIVGLLKRFSKNSREAEN